MKSWLLPALGYVMAVGFVGITSKLALRQVEWSVLLVSTTLAYVVITLIVGMTQGLSTSLPSGSVLLLVVVTGGLIAGSFVLFLFALERGSVSQVVPITAGYPLVAALLASVLLSEPVDVVRSIGIVLIVMGAILVSR